MTPDAKSQLEAAVTALLAQWPYVPLAEVRRELPRRELRIPAATLRTYLHGLARAARPPMFRSYRSGWERNPRPRAMPWAGMGRTVGAANPECHLLARELEPNQRIPPKKNRRDWWIGGALISESLLACMVMPASQDASLFPPLHRRNFHP